MESYRKVKVIVAKNLQDYSEKRMKVMNEYNLLRIEGGCINVYDPPIARAKGGRGNKK